MNHDRKHVQVQPCIATHHSVWKQHKTPERKKKKKKTKKKKKKKRFVKLIDIFQWRTKT